MVTEQWPEEYLAIVAAVPEVKRAFQPVCLFRIKDRMTGSLSCISSIQTFSRHAAGQAIKMSNMKVLKLVRKPKDEAAESVDTPKDKTPPAEPARPGPQSVSQPVVKPAPAAPSKGGKAAQTTLAPSSPRAV